MLLLKSMRRRRPLYDHLSVDRPPTGLQHALLLKSPFPVAKTLTQRNALGG